MPTFSITDGVRCHCWKNMSRWRRKAFHQENARRELKGKQPLPKPTNCNCGGSI